MTFAPSLLLAVEAGEHSNPIIPETNEIVWGLISFALLFVVLSKFVFPAMNKALAERTANIEGKLEQADRERQESAKLLASYQAKLQEANAEAGRIIEQARTNADRLEAELRAKAEDQARKIVERAQETIQAERDRALEALRGEVGGLAVDLAERVVGESLDRDRQLRLVDQYINDISGTRK